MELHGEEIEKMGKNDALEVLEGIRNGGLVFFYRAGESQWLLCPLATEETHRFSGVAYMAKRTEVEGEFSFEPVDLADGRTVGTDGKTAWRERLQCDATFQHHLVEKFANPKDAPTVETDGTPSATAAATNASRIFFRKYFGDDFTDSLRRV